MKLDRLAGQHHNFQKLSHEIFKITVFYKNASNPLKKNAILISLKKSPNDVV